MKILAIDSSGLTASVAVYSEGVILACQSVNNKKTHSQTLLPMIKDAVDKSGLCLEELDAVAIAEGPGSFTGLRIGAATVKGLCLAIDKPVIPVSTLAGMAANLYGTAGMICPIMDARRGQVYTAVYRYAGDVLQEMLSPAAVSVEELIDGLFGGLMGNMEDCNNANRHSEDIITFLGDGVPVHRDYIKSVMGERAHFAPVHLMYQNSASVAVLAADMAKNEGKLISADDFEPVYLRLSQAEREKLEREKTMRTSL